MSPLPPPNYTQAPNLLFDRDLKDIGTLAELKIYLAVIRATIGWHVDEEKLTLADLVDRTGLSRRSVIEGVKAAETRGRITRRTEGVHGLTETYFALSVEEGGADSAPVQILHGSTSCTGSDSAPVPDTRAQESGGKKNTPPNPLASEGEQAKWDRFMAELKSEVPDYTFHIWIEPIRLAERRGEYNEVLVVQGPDRIATWLRERYLPLLEGAAARVYGPRAEVEILESETERARKAQAAVAAARPPRRRRSPRRTA